MMSTVESLLEEDVDQEGWSFRLEYTESILTRGSKQL